MASNRFWAILKINSVIKAPVIDPVIFYFTIRRNLSLIWKMIIIILVGNLMCAGQVKGLRPLSSPLRSNIHFSLVLQIDTIFPLKATNPHWLVLAHSKGPLVLMIYDWLKRTGYQKPLSKERPHGTWYFWRPSNQRLASMVELCIV